MNSSRLQDYCQVQSSRALGDIVARMYRCLKYYGYDSKFANLVPEWAVWFSPMWNDLAERTTDLIMAARFQYKLENLALNL